MSNKIILAYSGGLDTSVAIKWLQEQYHYEVIAMVADLGEGKDLDAIKEKALKVGASKCYVVDLKKEFALSYLVPAIKANVLYEGVYPLISALSRPLIAKVLVDIAHQEGAVAVSHGCTGKGNDQVRFDVSINTLDPNLTIVAPVRENPMGREEAIAYARDNDIPLPIDLDNPYSIDLNLWGRSCECGVLEDPWVEPPEGAYAMTQSVTNAPTEEQYIEIDFHQGVPIALDGEQMSLTALIEQLNAIAGKHGVGRIDHIENRLIGIKSREVYEAPAAMTLIKAHQSLEALCLTKDVAQFKRGVEEKMADLIYEGLWYSPLRTALQAFTDESQSNVSGKVRVKLHKGQAVVVGRKSETSLYQFNLATYKPEDDFDHQASLGFIKIWGLPLHVHALVHHAKQSEVEEAVA